MHQAQLPHKHRLWFTAGRGHDKYEGPFLQEDNQVPSCPALAVKESVTEQEGAGWQLDDQTPTVSAVLACAVTCCAMLCCAMLCCAMLGCCALCQALL